VYAGCVTDKGISALKSKCRILSNLVAVRMDVTKEEEVAAVVEIIKADCGLFALVNNAGIGHGAVVDWMTMEGTTNTIYCIIIIHSPLP
jgi:NAD(P)-dependent dehydrogenase (short-subunit alcohol dehydrogenase family)